MITPTPNDCYDGLLWAVEWRVLLQLDDIAHAASDTATTLPAPCQETVAAIMGYLAAHRAATPYIIKAWAAAFAGVAPIGRD